MNGNGSVQLEEEVISEAVTSDNKQLMISRCLRGKLLARATTE